MPTQIKDCVKESPTVCGRVRTKHGNIIAINQALQVIPKNGDVESRIWRGLARLESYQTKWSHSVQLGIIPDLQSYFERDDNTKQLIEFTIPDGYGIAALLPTRRVNTYTPEDVLIVTRPAKTEEEIKVHDRHPKLLLL